MFINVYSFTVCKVLQYVNIELNFIYRTVLLNNISLNFCWNLNNFLIIKLGTYLKKYYFKYYGFNNNII